MKFVRVLCVSLSVCRAESCAPEDTIKQLVGDLGDELEDALPEIASVVKNIALVVEAGTGDASCFSDNVAGCISALLNDAGVISEAVEGFGSAASVLADALAAFVGVPWDCLIEDGFDFANQTISDLEPALTPFLNEIEKLVEVEVKVVEKVIQLFFSHFPSLAKSKLKNPTIQLVDNSTKLLSPFYEDIRNVTSFPRFNESFGSQIDGIQTALNSLSNSTSSLV